MPLRDLASVSLKPRACLNFSRRLLEMAICDEILKFYCTAFRVCLQIPRANLGLNFIYAARDYKTIIAPFYLLCSTSTGLIKFAINFRLEILVLACHAYRSAGTELD